MPIRQKKRKRKPFLSLIGKECTSTSFQIFCSRLALSVEDGVALENINAALQNFLRSRHKKPLALSVQRAVCDKIPARFFVYFKICHPSPMSWDGHDQCLQFPVFVHRSLDSSFSIDTLIMAGAITKQPAVLMA